MSRGIGEFELIQSELPEWTAVVFAALTQLGDAWFLLLVLTLLYWFDTPRRDDIAAVGGVTLAGMGLYKGLKELFSLPRPEQPLLDPVYVPGIIQPLYEATATVGGYGFPSGHAVNSTIVYGGLALALVIGTKRQRFALAAAIVALVCFTRVALGVHYVVDVVAGIAVGVALLAGSWALLNRNIVDRPTVTFGLGVGFCAFFLATTEFARDAVALLGAALGGFAGWQLVVLGRRLVDGQRLTDALGLIVPRGAVALTAVLLLVLSIAVAPFPSRYTVGGAVGLGVAVVVVLPLGGQQRDSGFEIAD